MSFPKLRGYAVYWPPLNEGKVNAQGKVVISGEPIEVRVHWEDVQKEFRDPMGELMVSNSMVMCNKTLLPKGILKRGRLSNLESLNHQSNNGTFVILGTSVVESVSARRSTLEYYL